MTRSCISTALDELCSFTTIVSVAKLARDSCGRILGYSFIELVSQCLTCFAGNILAVQAGLVFGNYR